MEKRKTSGKHLMRNRKLRREKFGLKVNRYKNKKTVELWQSEKHMSEYELGK